MASNIRNFKAVGDNLFIIANKILADDDICKLLYFTDSNPLSHDNLSEDEKSALLNKNILLVPKVPENDDIKGNYILILYDGFNQNLTNPQFKDADSVMIILDTAEFIKQFEDACNSRRAVVAGALYHHRGLCTRQ